MKLIVAVVSDAYAVALTEQLTKKGFGATKLASTGGFLKAGNTTFLIGVPAGQLDEIRSIIAATCPAPQSATAAADAAADAVKRAGTLGALGSPVQVAGATVFVLAVEKMVKV